MKRITYVAMPTVKKGDIRQALNNYLTAMDLNSDSPAQIAHDQLISIMNFYNKDMFNQ